MSTLDLVAAAAAVASFFLLLWRVRRGDANAGALRQEARAREEPGRLEAGVAAAWKAALRATEWRATNVGR